MNRAASTSLPNIILIGLMGCGKTTIGKELHRETNLGFTDTDQLIEPDGNAHSADFQKFMGNHIFETWKPESCNSFRWPPHKAALFPQEEASLSDRKTGCY